MSGKVNLDRWRPHLVAAKREGKSLSQYARGHGLSAHTLYAARQMLGHLENKAGLAPKPRLARRTRLLTPAAFAAVKFVQPDVCLNGAAPQLHISLPNGVRLELISLDATLLTAAIAALARP